MRYGIYFCFDPETEKRLQSLRERLASDIPGLPSITGKMRPHLTLLVFNGSDLSEIQQLFAAYAESVSRFAITLQQINVFQGRNHVVYAEPSPSQMLQQQFISCQQHFPHYVFPSTYSDAAHWHPHVTLAKGMDLQSFQMALTLAKQLWHPLEALISNIGLINLQKPLDVLAERQLTGCT
ncbi:MAG TPA: 2'-5' RNA ligase family protein [Rickettsiales bacterium]|nr:2'-5' RNA ligase family protein [Rickettsiales bacterium]